MNIALTIAGSDSGGGAGIQADLKTFHQCQVFGTSVVVAVTAQNTRGVSAIHAIPGPIVDAQLEALAVDLPPAAVKTGMLATADLVARVATAVRTYRFPNLVVDPVMVASSGDRLLEDDGVETVLNDLVPLATLVTPNLHEAALLAGFPIRSVEEMEAAGRALLARGAGAALVKGGHLTGDRLTDVLVTGNDVIHVTGARVDTGSTHGTGCTLSAAAAAGLARGYPLEHTVRGALAFVRSAIEQAPGLGSGHGPLNHFVSDPFSP